MTRANLIKGKVRLRIAPLWDPTAAELLRRAREREFQVRQLLGDRKAEDRYAAGVARRVAANVARSCIKFVNRVRSRA